ncbi:UDP-N-acetylglucosamine 2-epimerase (non-hydrolysing) [Kytococcus aerolatus]|uniref:UDP-N-acetylglucosamine 2-epimerase (Non-hydrolysing) n=1 Tax=Kytococcus aerolatus TaxID=592308 RepID=A0A212TH18_9MICO|nr:UDP-N-acetylglucosamine 2-epimerase (non-hydrolyzing) [Kytococcus aerolatus]SNC65329.1 UDP-N-acetylglucosamine 2-epimerase (non-hydrolysing) [Kytococcus aerolatus]
MNPLVVHVTGARPNFPKVAPVMRALEAAGVEQLLVHTGQHYDEKMSDVFFRQLGIPEPDVNLGVGSGTHGVQTAKVMMGLEELFTERQPALVVVYGDVNSTVAASLVAAKMGIDTAHVEAGLRSFDLTMPEEINRLVTDRLATLLLTTSSDANVHLGNEGADPQAVHFVGNPMIDTLLSNLERYDTEAALASLGDQVPAGVSGGQYAVVTVHRPGNVDLPEDVQALVRSLHSVADRVPVIVPLHPRGRTRLQEAGFMDHENVHVVDPLGYLEFMGLVRGAALVVTDSGGVQEETTVLGVPCLTVRPNTERPVTITHGTNQLVTREGVAEAAAAVLERGPVTDHPVPPLWDGHAGERIATVITGHLGIDG